MLSFNLKVDVVTRCHCRGVKLLPKQTVFNLPKDKKDHLLYAVEKEFSRVPLYEASISNIVKTADIPRGSFYQYFEDKEDAYFYLLNEQVEAKKNQFLKCLQEHDGNVFDRSEERRVGKECRWWWWRESERKIRNKGWRKERSRKKRRRETSK